MLVVIYVCVMLQLIGVRKSEFEAKIVGGHFAKITDFAHSAFLVVKCALPNEPDAQTSWMCGASILNQELLLTAAHCVAECLPQSWLVVSVGHAHVLRGCRHTVNSFLVHEKYHPDTTINDIGLVSLRTPITFSSTVNRVILMPNPPYEEKAQVAGWGMTDEKTKQRTEVLKYTRQYAIPNHQCRDLTNGLPAGTICVKKSNSPGYPAVGDSGSALVVQGYIQIGIVSYKSGDDSSGVVVYTDTGYFYDWIQRISTKLMTMKKIT